MAKCRPIYRGGRRHRTDISVVVPITLSCRPRVLPGYKVTWNTSTTDIVTDTDFIGACSPGLISQKLAVLVSIQGGSLKSSNTQCSRYSYGACNYNHRIMTCISCVIHWLARTLFIFVVILVISLYGSEFEPSLWRVIPVPVNTCFKSTQPPVKLVRGVFSRGKVSRT